ncbi:MAG TPA: acetyl-CoA carboxylase biotin carboxyl carrier protein [Longimicrobium sp.]|nr:acetyl-CoA carboxylase biotin carboxyl carrier protein [Longimicrobium sp.]
MIDLEFLRGLIGAVDESGIDSIEISRGGTLIRINKTPPAAPVSVSAAASAPAGPPAHLLAQPISAPAAPSAAPPAGDAAPAAPPKSSLVEIKSPMVGTFYRSPAPEAPAYVEVGSRVAKGQTLCILEAMKLMNELESDLAGTVREVCVENGEPVEYGQVLFRIEPSA